MNYFVAGLAVGTMNEINGGAVYLLSLDPTLYGTQYTGGDYPSHGLSSDLFLGAGVDGETRQRSDVEATLDDFRGAINDDDGLVDAAADLKLIVGDIPKIHITATNQTNRLATVHGWIDFNRDGDFLDEGEHDFGYVEVGGMPGEFQGGGTYSGPSPGPHKYEYLEVITLDSNKQVSGVIKNKFSDAYGGTQYGASVTVLRSPVAAKLVVGASGLLI